MGTKRNVTGKGGGGYRCRKCKRRPVMTKGAVCGPCAKPKKAAKKNGRGHTASARPVRGNAAAVLARSAPVATADYYATRCAALVTTDDVLRANGLTMLTATPAQFREASRLADEYNNGVRALVPGVCHA